MENMEIREVCRDKDICGGCVYQGVPYEEQLSNKFGEVKGLLDKKDIRYGELLPIEGAPSRYGYRNKMEYTFGDMEKNGPMTLGMHKKKHFMSIVTVDQCQLVHEDFNVILRGVLEFASSRGYKHYHKKAHKGLMRHLIVRRGIRTGELLVNVVTSSEDGFDENAFVEMIRALPLENQVVGILRTINDRLADAVYCDELRVLWGRDYYNEEILGLKFKVSAFSFFQTNVDAVERLYSYAVSLIDDFENKEVFDLYCGTGTITQVLARKAKEVIGIELVEEAVEAAKTNAALNGLDNCRFLAGDVFEVLDSLPDKPEVIVVDPPRVGISSNALEKIIGYGVKQIVYISCNPKSLADNLYYMQYYGYEIKSVKPFDNFPGTKHVETVVLLSHKKPDSHINIKVEFGEGEGKVPLKAISERAEAYKPKERVTYKMIKEYIEAKYGFKVHTAYIAEVKRDLGLPMYDAPNAVEELKQPRKHPTAEKVEAIKDALKYFKVFF